MSIAGHLGMYWRFALHLRRFLKQPMNLEECRRIVQQRLLDRDKTWLAILKRAVFDYPASPYLKLLGLSACEYGDLERMVRADGIEAALMKLRDAGVYLTFEEFKRGQAVVRGSQKIYFKEREFDNPLTIKLLKTASGASRSAGTRTVYDFEFLTANGTVYGMITLAAFDALKIPFGMWGNIMPGAGPPAVLAFTKGGKTPVRWFSPVEKKGFKPILKHRAGTNFIVYTSRLMGAKLPVPEYVPLNEAWRVTQWMADQIRENGGCGLMTITSLAVRVCQAARGKGIDLKGARFMTIGEPLTVAKRKEIEAAGAAVCSNYGFTEAGFVGTSCFDPLSEDDTHVFRDSFALIPRRREVLHSGVIVDAFLFTSLQPFAPKLLLNVESGDYGILTRRDCHCALGELGFVDHISGIYGFDKLTGSGMTFVASDLVHLLDEVLPARFGGSSMDYQMMEEEDPTGHTRLSILISPRVGAVNEEEVVAFVLAQLRKGNDSNRMMANIWTQANMLRVKRLEPYTTARGKLLPLHILKSG
jgi:hypothetical protein